MSAHEEVRVEWRVETETLEDEFGTDESGAREWLARCLANPDWEPAKLMSRVVVVRAGDWFAVSTDDEQFCSRCLAGVESSEHHQKCVTAGQAEMGESA